MSNIKKVEKKLREYNFYKIRVENLKERLELLEEEDGIGAIDYDQVGSGKTNKINNIVEEIGLSNIEEADYIKHLIRRSQHEISSIDRALEALRDEEATIIREWYFNENTARYIAKIVGMSESTLFRIKEQALESMSIALI